MKQLIATVTLRAMATRRRRRRWRITTQRTATRTLRATAISRRRCRRRERIKERIRRQLTSMRTTADIMGISRQLPLRGRIATECTLRLRVKATATERDQFPERRRILRPPRPEWERLSDRPRARWDRVWVEHRTLRVTTRRSIR